MKSEYFQQLARMMQITPAELSKPPMDAETARKYDRALSILNAMSPEQLDAWLRMGEATVKPQR